MRERLLFHFVIKNFFEEPLIFFAFSCAASELGGGDVVLPHEYVKKRGVIFISHVIGDLLEGNVLIQKTVVRHLHSQIVTYIFR